MKEEARQRSTGFEHLLAPLFESLRGRQADSSENNPGPPSRKVQNALMPRLLSGVAGSTHAAMPDHPGSHLPAPKPFGADANTAEAMARIISGIRCQGRVVFHTDASVV